MYGIENETVSHHEVWMITTMVMMAAKTTVMMATVEAVSDRRPRMKEARDK